MGITYTCDMCGKATNSCDVGECDFEDVKIAWMRGNTSKCQYWLACEPCLSELELIDGKELAHAMHDATQDEPKRRSKQYWHKECKRLEGELWDAKEERDELRERLERTP